MPTRSRRGNTWLSARPVPAKMLVALGLTMVFLIVRWVMSTAISLLSNWWIAEAVGCLLGAIIAAPSLFTFLGRTILRGRAEKAADEPKDA